MIEAAELFATKTAPAKRLLLVCDDLLKLGSDWLEWNHSAPLLRNPSNNNPFSSNSRETKRGSHYNLCEMKNFRRETKAICSRSAGRFATRSFCIS